MALLKFDDRNGVDLALISRLRPVATLFHGNPQGLKQSVVAAAKAKRDIEHPHSRLLPALLANFEQIRENLVKRLLLHLWLDDSHLPASRHGAAGPSLGDLDIAVVVGDNATGHRHVATVGPVPLRETEHLTKRAQLVVDGPMHVEKTLS